MGFENAKKQSIFAHPVWAAVLAIFCCLLWGSAFPTIKIGYELFQIPSEDFASKLVFAGVRFSAAGVLTLLGGWAVGKKFPTLPRQAFGKVAGLGLVQTTLQYIFYYWGVAHTTGVRGSILNSTSTFFAIILGHIFLAGGDKITKGKVLGCLLGFGGVVVASLGGQLGGGFSLSGDGAILAASFCFALAGLISKKLAQQYNGIAITGWNLLFGGTVLVVAGLALGGRLAVVTPTGLATLLYLCILSALAFTLWTLLLQHNPLSKISIYYFLMPVFGALFSALLLNENLWDFKYIAALVLVCTGIYMVNRAEKKTQPA